MQLLLSTGNPLEIEGEFLGEPWVRVQAPQVSGRPYDFKTWFIQRLQKFVVTSNLSRLTIFSNILFK